MGPQEILVALSVLTMLVFRRRVLAALTEGIDNFNNFRGGPPTPMHPSPADDGAILRRRVRKVEN
jgi:hypothetical protein